MSNLSGRRGWGGRVLGGLAIGALFVLGSAGVAMAQANGAESGLADIDRGEKLFSLCTQCHGADGGGRSENLAPAIAGMPSWYVEAQLRLFSNGSRGMHPDDTGGLRMYPMSLWLREEADQRDIAAYVASMPKVTPVNTLDVEADPARGAGLYAVCSACHAPDGTGNQGMGAPGLVGMSDWYLFSSIAKYKSGTRGNGPGDTLGPAMIGMVATLPDDQAIHDVIAHIQSLGK